MFQQFRPNSFLRSTPLGLDPLSLCKLLIPYLTSSPLEYNLLSQFHYINPVSTEFQYRYPLWIVSFLLLAVTSLGLCLFICFNAAATSLILIQSAGPSLTVVDILWSDSFSSFISFSMYSFRESLIPFSSTIIFTWYTFQTLWPVISCLSFTICFAIRKILFCWLGSFKSHAHSCFFPFAKEITLLCFVYSSCTLPCLCRFSNFHTFSSFPLLLQQLPHSTTLFPYACMGFSTIHMWPVLCPSLYFSSVTVFIYIKVFPL